MFDNVRADVRAAKRWNTGSVLGELLNPGTQAVVVYRFGHWVCGLRVPVVRHLLMALYLFVNYFVQTFLGVFIHPRAEIGPGLLVHSWGGIFIAPIRIGRNLVVQTGVHMNWNVVEIGDDVVLGPGCKIGPDLRIGSRVVVGPNAVIMQDVPDDTTVAVLPPRMLRIRLRDRVRIPPEEAARRAGNAAPQPVSVPSSIDQ